MRAFRIISLISVSDQPTTSAFYFIQRRQLLGAKGMDTPQCPVVTIRLKPEAPLIQASNDFSHLLALHCAGCVFRVELRFALTGLHSTSRARGVLYLL